VLFLLVCGGEKVQLCRYGPLFEYKAGLSRIPILSSIIYPPVQKSIISRDIFSRLLQVEKLTISIGFLLLKLLVLRQISKDKIIGLRAI
jgi:hypothetical protein